MSDHVPTWVLEALHDRAKRRQRMTTAAVFVVLLIVSTGFFYDLAHS